MIIQILNISFMLSVICAFNSFYLRENIFKNIVQNSLYNYTVLNAFMNNICTQYCTDSKLTGIIHRIILNLAIN